MSRKNHNESSPYVHSSLTYGSVADTHETASFAANVEVAEEDYQPVFRDVPFSILFGIHIVIMLVVGIQHGSFRLENTSQPIQEKEGYQEDGLKQSGIYAEQIIFQLIIPCAVAAFFFACIVTGFIIPSCPKVMVMASLIGSLAWTIAVAIVICMNAHVWYAFLGAAALIGITLWYVIAAWRLIPFAASNLGMALQGVRSNMGVYAVAICFSLIGIVWTIFWCYVTIGITNEARAEYNENTTEHTNDRDYEYDNVGGGHSSFVFFLLLVSLYWTSNVISNTVQVTVAGVIGTWCFDKDGASSCCSPAVNHSIYRSVSYSFGSICMGSLLQAVVTALRVMVSCARDQARNSNDNGIAGILLCILECIVRLLEDIIEYFNQWAYVFVGIYGYGYLESGQKVIELFRARGLTTIIANDLVGWVLNFTILTVGALTGWIAICIDGATAPTNSSLLFGDMPNPRYWAFGLGFVIGIVVCSAMTSVIKGAVNTLIVCFADAPAKLEENHPQETKKMAASWISAFPQYGVCPTYSVVV